MSRIAFRGWRAGSWDRPRAEAGRNEKPKTGREQRRGTVCVQAAAHRGTGEPSFFCQKEAKKARGTGKCPPSPPPARGGFSPDSSEAGRDLRFWQDAAWPARPYTAPGFCCRCVAERLRAVPAGEKRKGRGSAPGHGRVSSTERLAGQGSGHSPKPRAAVAYGPSPGYCPQPCRAYRPDKEAGTARPGLLRGGRGITFLA